MKLGIDFGTCYSFMTTMIGKDPCTTITDPKEGIATVFYYSSATNKEHFGQEAIDKSFETPLDLISQLKRKIREDGNLLSENNQMLLKSSDQSFTTSQVTEKILAHLIERAKFKAKEQGLPAHENLDIIERITITTPAGLGQDANSATEYNKFLIRCVKNVTGLSEDKIHIIEEPKAAAIAYLYENRSSTDQKILVYDLGGGTIDVSIVEYISATESYLVKATAGDTKVGGVDWDKALADLIVSKIGVSPKAGTKDSVRFDKEVIETKHGLTDRESYSSMPRINNVPYEARITRDEFNFATKSHLDKTITVVKKALSDYKGTGSGILKGINKIILVGGASIMPQVRERLLKEFPDLGDKGIVKYKPSSAISIGAAINSFFEHNTDQTAKKVVSDAASHTYGVNCIDPSDNVLKISNILLKDTPYKNGVLTAKGDSIYFPDRKDQRSVTIKVYEHDEKTEFTKLDEISYRGDSCSIAVPYELYSQDKSKEFTYYLRLTLKNQIVEIEVTDSKTGKIIPHKT